MQDYRKLKVWEKADRVALEAYRLTDAFHVVEKFGLISQIRRAAISIPTNIAEGCGRNSVADFTRFLDIANGSANELEYLFDISGRLNLMSLDESKKIQDQIIEIKRMLNSFIQKLRPDTFPSD